MCDLNRCVLCGEKTEVKGSVNFDCLVVKCVKYKMIYNISRDQLLNNNKIRACLRYYLIHNTANNDKPYYITDEWFASEDYNVLTVGELLNIYPKTVSERIDKVLLNLAAYSSEIGSSIEIEKNEDSASVFSSIFFLDYNKLFWEKLNRFILMLERMTYLKRIYANSLTFEIDYSGWERLDALNSKNATQRKGFVAMWFDKSMSKYRQAIIDAISETGYTHSIIDEKEYNGQIVPEILYEIRTSDFVIADLTGNRGGVYYEAGYALALDKELIITIKDTGKQEKDLTVDEQLKYIPHFDVAQRNQVRYKDEEDLKIKLIKRITATVGNKKAIKYP